jgi:signal transduction histidine kinase
MRETAINAGCEFSCQGAGPILGRWDRLRIEQVVMNLLSNAFKYGAGHPVALSVSVVDGEAVIEVRDEGPGVPQADLERIFERFERAAPTRDHGGLGLGLYVSRQIASAHAGSIAARNLPGGGAALTMRLPIDA